MNDALPTELFSSTQKSIRLLTSKQQTDAFIMNIPGDRNWKGFQQLQNIQHSFPLRPVTWAKRFPALLGIGSSIISDLTYLQLPVSERSDNDKKAPVQAVLVPGLSINK